MNFNIKSILSYILTVFLIFSSLSLVFAGPNDNVVTLPGSDSSGDFTIFNGLKVFGTFYDGLKSNSNILDGIAILVFFAGMYSVFLNLTRFVFKGENNKSARKGASMILSILVTGALVMALKTEQSFVGYYGGMILFILTLFVLIFGYVAYAKWVTTKFENKGARITLWALGLIVIDVTMSSIIIKLFGAVGKQGLVYWISTSIGAIVAFAIPLIFVGLIWWALSSKNSSSSDEKIEKAVESEEDKIKKERIKKVRGLTKIYADSLKKGFESGSNKRKKLRELQNLIQGGLN